MRAVIASGSGRYADPWHPYAETSPLLAEILETAGFDVLVDDDVDRALAGLGGVDLLVVNAGDPWRSDEPGSAPAVSVAGFASALERGIGVIGVHAALASLRDYPEWAPAIGAVWLPGSSWHPPRGTVTVHGLTLPDGTAVEDLEVDDERYLRLQRLGRSHTVADHEVDDERHPAAWVRQVGSARVAVDALGHDARSYASPGHRSLVTRLARWVTAGSASA